MYKSALVKTAGVLAAGVLLGACATLPAGPSVLVLPGTSKTFEQFQVDDAACRQWAAQQAGMRPEQAAAHSAAGGAAAGAVVGTAVGAAVGSASGHAGAGAAVGAGVGLLTGTAIGSERGRGAANTLQRRYDGGYMQCMYAKGNRIPVPKGAVRSYRQSIPPPPPEKAAPAGIPPPPAGTPPPPPPPGSSG